MKSLHTLWITAVLALVSGCVAPVTGQLPRHYAENKYPVLAVVHGVKRTTFAKDLHEIVMTYTPAAEIERNTNTTHGYLIHIKPAEKPIRVKEVYILPRPARWGTKDEPVRGRVSKDGTTCVTEWTAFKGAEYVEGGWGMFSDDPLGQYHWMVFFDGRLAAEFKFRVVPPQMSP